ncbi:hypothetical protein [Candidatus Tisiphia endosymbiont of Thecophora atra]|uniref:hypothetical protein n=1 Tax=Candidatus Tisiphia endosymbiont of Thecophora atra TaxID=3066258 RepID=UPI00312CC0B2
MKWQVIAGISQRINEEAKGYLIRKLEKDANVETPHLWSDFLSDTTKHLNQSQSNIEVATNSKTGGLTCLTQFDEMHPDFLENNKPCLDYFLSKYDQRANDYLQRTNNPLTKRLLQAKINDYRISLAGQISHTEAKLIDGKRHHLAIEAIEKLKNATYDNPQLYTNHLQDITIALSSLSLPPLEQDNMLLRAKQDLAYAAALGTLRQSPHSILNPNMMFDWKQNLSLEQRIKLEGQANNLLHHQQIMQQQQLHLLIKSHFDSILEKGQGIDGIDNLVQKSFDPNDPRLLQFKAQETLYKEAFIIRQQLKLASLDQYQQILQQIAPNSGDIDYHQKEQIYHILQQECDRQIKLAKTDPAKYVEQLYVEDIPKDMPLFQRYQLRKQLQQQKGIASYNQKYLMQAERDEFLKKIASKDINQIKQTIDSIINLQDIRDNVENSRQYGVEILEEILSDKGDIELLIHSYADNKMYNRNFASVFLEMLPIKDQLFNNQEKTEFNKAIDENNTIKEWSKNLARANIQSAAEINYMRQGIRYLARYYQRVEGLTIKDSVTKATKKMISEVYMSIDSKNLQIPRQIIVEGMIHDLNADYIEASLSELQVGIITGNVSYNYATSFSVTGDATSDPARKYAAERVLREGKWKLTPNKKSVYYTFPTKEGHYLPIMATVGQILKFDLLELNNPLALERQRQRLKQLLQVNDLGEIYHAR